MARKSCTGFFCFAAAMAVVFSAVMARAGGVDPGEEPPGELRILTFDDATTTSTCIGRPVTPLCAVETVEACFFRWQPGLCIEMDYAMPPPPRRKPLTRWRKQETLRYKVIEISKMTGPVYPPYYRARGVTPWRDGDVKILIRSRHCHPSAPPPDFCSPWNKVSNTYVARPAGAKWRIIDVITPRQD